MRSGSGDAVHFLLCTNALGFENGFSLISPTQTSIQHQKESCKMGQCAPTKFPAIVCYYTCLWRRLTAASPVAGLGPLFPPHCGQRGLASRSSGSNSSVGGVASLSPP